MKGLGYSVAEVFFIWLVLIHNTRLDPIYWRRRLHCRAWCLAKFEHDLSSCSSLNHWKVGRTLLVISTRGMDPRVTIRPYPRRC